MAISHAVQTLSAAFSFGILLQAATGALLIYFRGHASTIFKDGRRLVLVLFLLFAALWAQVDFLNLLITAEHSTLCQATLLVSTAFDQLARFGVEQFLLWSVGQGTKANTGRLILQAILGLRLIAGGILVGFTRPDFAPVCIARTSLEPVAVVVIALDIVIIGFLVVRSISGGMFRDMKDSRSSTRDQSKGLILTIVGITFWTATSVPMLLGVSTIILSVRTVVPTNGLLILVGILTISSGSLLDTREEITTPEAHSPFVAPSQSTREIFREEVGNGSPIAGPTYTRGGSLFFVNPSSTQRDSPNAAQGYFTPASQDFSKLGEEITVRDLGAGEPGPTNITGYRGSSGIFPTIITSSMRYDQGALAPQIRPNAVDRTRNVAMPVVSLPSTQQKKFLFNRSKQPLRPNVRALGISKPIMVEDEMSAQQPFARIPTIDLAQAAANDRERRAAAADRSRLVAHRPAPPPPQQFSFPAQEGLRKSISVKRKEMPSRLQEAMQTIASSASSGLSVEAANGSTTSASLSPGREEVRRRSPRNANSFGPFIDEKGRPLPTLQRKQTLGLPSNPRARMTAVQPMAKEQTVMFMNDIVYDNPGIVKTIVKGAPEVYAASKRAKALEETPATPYTAALKSSDSIIHRPRPYRRDIEKDRALFSSEPSPRHHRRSKSASSIVTHKSIFMSLPGSPTQLPPLPPPPTSASKLKRLLPNDTRSMTVDEKIHLLFPAPPGASVLNNRRSSVPSLPRASSVFMSEISPMHSPTQGEQASRRASKRTTIASFEVPAASGQASNRLRTSGIDRQNFRFSANTYLALADHGDETVMSRRPIDETSTKRVALNVATQDYPNLRNTRELKMTNPSIDDKSIYWGSVHSEIPPVELSNLMRNANQTFIQRSRAGTTEDRTPLPPAEQIDEPQDGEEIMTVMLDCEDGRPAIMTSSEADQPSFFLDAEQELVRDQKRSRKAEKTWHRRIGDELPTFSERKTKTRSRKMPPPTPLLLNQRGRTATVIVRAEPSPPVMDSPQRAIAEIQAHLRRFEEPGRGSVGSLLRNLPDAGSKGDENPKEDHNERFKLLENLENEMGQQQNQWQQMQTNLDRDSMSTIATPYAPAQSESEISRESSQRSSRPPPRAVSRRARIRSNVTARSKGDESTSTTSTQSSDNLRASHWQQRLAEAQLEYMENAPALLRKRSVNFLSVSRSHQLGSPTPPESVDSGTDIETDSDSEWGDEEAFVMALKETISLWQAPLSVPEAASGLMWTSPAERPQRTKSPEPPAKNIRPAQRQFQSALKISSSDLWVMPASSANSRPVKGLWGPRIVRPVRIRTRPLTQRPARKSKRVTFLPDIVESPVPLPNKRDTLGIFQFPWGETSDSAVYQPVFRPALLAGPIINAKLDKRFRQLEPEPEYSSSFFDDYDDDFDEDEETESDDDFDETTLWEIASLLKSEDVPSKNSLLPRLREVIEAYEVEEETDFEEDSEVEDAYQKSKAVQKLVTELPIMPLAMLMKEEPQTGVKEESRLWTPASSSTMGAVKIDLPQPKLEIWQTYIPSSEDVVRSEVRPFGELSVLASRDMCTASKSEATSLSDSTMWKEKSTSKAMSAMTATPKKTSQLLWMSQPEQVEVATAGMFSLETQRSEFRTTQKSPAAISMFRAPRSTNTQVSVLSSQSLWAPEKVGKEPTVWITNCFVTQPETQAQSLWTPTAGVAIAVMTGLFSPSQARSDFRSTSLKPAALDMVRKPRKTISPLAQLTTHQIWRLPSSLIYEHHWITKSNVRPTSPSTYSESSSSPTSPDSEASSLYGASIKSTSTKASSVWGNVNNASTPAWWDDRGSRKPSGLDSKGENAKAASKLPAVRESRVLALSDMWEAKVPMSLGETPKRNPRKSALVKNEAEAVGSLVAPTKSKLSLQRPKATPAIWHAALEEAIAKGIIPITIPTASISPYDPAVLHPVFFTSSLLSAIVDVYPASIGHMVRPQARTLCPSHCIAALIDAPVGPMWLTGKVEATQFDHYMTEKKRSFSISRSIELQVLESANLPPPSTSAKERNWIAASDSAPAQMWTAPKVIVKEESNSLWSAQTRAKAEEEQSRFENPHCEPWRRVKRSDSGVEMSKGIKLESTEMWKPKWQIPESPKRWLEGHEKRISKVQFRY